MSDRTSILAAGLATAAIFASATTVAQDLDELMAVVNDELAAAGAAYQLEMIEYITAGDEIGRTALFGDVGNKQLEIHFVPGDARRGEWSNVPGETDDVTWASDMVEGSADGLDPEATQTAISNAMATWQGQSCSTIPLTFQFVGGDLGVSQFLATLGLSGSPLPAADLVHAGFGGLDALLPPPIIAATLTFVFLDAVGDPTDIDNDGKLDAAFREIYYTNNFPWAIGADVDVETIALHETGHGLSQAHFGKLFRTDANGKLHFAPRALMNAGYTGVLRKVARSDNGGHCSIWASWPNR